MLRGLHPAGYTGYKRIAALQLPHPIPAKNIIPSRPMPRRATSIIAGCRAAVRLLDGLRGRLTQPHHPVGYDNALVALYASVDRWPDGIVRSIYSQAPLQAVSYPSLGFDQLETSDAGALAAASLGSPEVLGAWLAFQKGCRRSIASTSCRKTCFIGATHAQRPAPPLRLRQRSE